MVPIGYTWNHTPSMPGVSDAHIWNHARQRFNSRVVDMFLRCLKALPHALDKIRAIILEKLHKKNINKLEWGTPLRSYTAVISSSMAILSGSRGPVLLRGDTNQLMGIQAALMGPLLSCTIPCLTSVLMWVRGYLTFQVVPCLWPWALSALSHLLRRQFIMR